MYWGRALGGGSEGQFGRENSGSAKPHQNSYYYSTVECFYDFSLIGEFDPVGFYATPKSDLLRKEKKKKERKEKKKAARF